MIWDQPKKLIKQAMLVVSVLSLVLAIFWLYIFYIWNNKPNIIRDYDLSLPNHYENHITRLQTRIAKAKSPLQKYERSKILAEALSGVISFNKHYDLLKEANVNIIDYLIENDELNEAINVAKNWQESYPFDFNVKYKYAEVLSMKDPKLELEYYQELYQNHKDIEEVGERFVSKLLERGEFNKAFLVASESSKYFVNNMSPKFRFYYLDSENEKYSENSIITSPNFEILENQDVYWVQLEESFDKLNGLRMDIDSILKGTVISNININIATKENKHTNISVTPINHIKSKDSQFIVTGPDPYFKINLPESLLEYEDLISLQMKVKLASPLSPLMLKIINNKTWQIFTSNSKKFNEKDSFKIVMDRQDFQFSNTVNLEYETRFIRFDFPHFINMKFKDLRITIDESEELLEDKVVHLHSIERSENGSFVIIGKDPYIVFDRGIKTHVSNLKTSFELSSD